MIDFISGIAFTIVVFVGGYLLYLGISKGWKWLSTTLSAWWNSTTNMIQADLKALENRVATLEKHTSTPSASS